LTSLLKKDEKSKFKIKFVLISERIESMKALKRVFTSASMLRYYEFDDESTMITMNVLNFVIARMFFQLEEIDDQWRSMIFFFKKMTISKRNYEVDEQEMFAIIKVCKKWRHYVKNFKYFVRMIINHANLKNFLINENLSRRKVKWWKRLTKLNFKIKYRFDKNNLVDDSSRRRNYENQTATKNKFKNENLNLKKWALIENNASFKNKNKKNKKKKLFLCRVEIDTSF
jgi:hypothetical protein